MAFSNQALRFESEALRSDDALIPTKIVGEERLSGTFRFEIDLVSADEDIEPEDVLHQPAKVGFARPIPGGSTMRWFSGTVSVFEVLEEGQGWIGYRAVVVPDLWKLTEFRRNRAFLNVTSQEVVESVLEDDLELSSKQDFEFKLTRGQGDRKTRDVYPEREYVVQYEESSLDFVSRWLEREGIFYFFENDGDREKVVFGDAVSAYKPATPSDPTVAYRPQGQSTTTGTTQTQAEKGALEEIHSFTGTHSRLPKKVVLKDYNWRDPQVSLDSSCDVWEKGAGVVFKYNDHYKTKGQGKAQATVVAEERSCRAAHYRGAGTCRAFRPGKTFDLTEHFRDDLNRTYLLTSVRHEAEQSVNLESANVTGDQYQNSFGAIPADVTFRPGRVTPWPSIRGVMHARVDAEGDGKFAEIDDHGRYKVVVPFDEHASEAKPGKASRWMRMAQPYAGVDSGSHYPLLKGTEVLLTHIDGDPDRPIIAAAIPNPDTVSPVNGGNKTQNKVKTTTGNTWIADDDPGCTGIAIWDALKHVVEDMRINTGPSEGDEAPTTLKGKLEEWVADTSADSGFVSDGRGPLGESHNGASANLDQTGVIKTWSPSRLNVGRGDLYQLLKIPNKITYGDISNDVSYGTGGYSYHREDGPTEDESYQNGDQTSYSEVRGNETSESWVYGDTDSKSYEIGAHTEFSLAIGAKASLSIGADASTETEICASAKNENEITAAAKASMSITAAAEVEMNICAGASADFTIATAKAEFEIDPKVEITIPSDNEYTLQKAEADIALLSNHLQKTDSALQETANALQSAENKLQATANELQSTQNQLQSTENKLQATESQLQSTENKLQETANKLQETENKLQKAETSLQDTQTSAVHMIQ